MSEKNAPNTFIEWLGFRTTFDYSKARPLGAAIGFLVGLTLVLVIITAGMAFYQFFLAVSGVSVGTHEAIRNLGLVLAALIGVPFIIWRSVVAQKQVNVAEHGLMSDRITRAVDQLGSNKIVVRTGAIFALESIMMDSEENRIRMWQIVNAFLIEEQRALRTKKRPNNPPDLSEDIQAAITVLTRQGE
jgi:uncharacterized membrane protein required for colicin V production